MKLLAVLILATLVAGLFSATLEKHGEGSGVAVQAGGEHTAEKVAEGRPGQAIPRPSATPRPASRSRRSLPSGRQLPSVLLRIRWCESRDNYRAQNRHSSASGGWQITDGTWDHFRGYRRAVHAPRWVQDAKALALFADRGTQPWNASRRCWS